MISMTCAHSNMGICKPRGYLQTVSCLNNNISYTYLASNKEPRSAN